jgi:hypothetical protein
VIEKSSSVDKRIGLIVFISILLLHPMLFIFFISFLMIYFKKLNNSITLMYVIFFFIGVFYFREYNWTLKGSSDDISNYLIIFDIFSGHGLFTRSSFLELAKFGLIAIEPFYWLVYYSFGVVTSFNVYIYIFLNISISLWIFIFYIKKYLNEYYLLGFLFIIFFNSGYLYLFTTAVYRQLFSISFLIAGTYYFMKSNNKLSYLFFVLSVLSHFSNIIFITIAILISVINKKQKIYLSMKNIMRFIFLSGIFLIFIFTYQDLFLNKLSKLQDINLSILTFNLIKYLPFLFLSYYIFKYSIRKNLVELKRISIFIFLSLIILVILSAFPLIFSRIEATVRILATIQYLIFIRMMINYHPKYKDIIIMFIILLTFSKLLYLSLFITSNQNFLLFGNFDSIIIYSIFDFFNDLTIFNINI